MFLCDSQWKFCFECFQYLTLKQIFWKTKTFFKIVEYHFLVESTNIENASFLYKAALPEANVKANRMVSTKWAYHNGGSFASNYFTFLKFCFISRTSYKVLIWSTNNPNVYKRWSFIWWCFFTIVSLINKKSLEWFLLILCKEHTD